jgi:DNA polymerase-3 subunit delta'
MSWRHVLGHDANVAAFASAWTRRRLGHAYLFVGPGGVGKHTFAIELAKTVLCENRRDQFEACDQCASCHLVDARTHPDLYMVKRPEDKHEFPIGLLRRNDSSPDEPVLLEQLAMKPARGSRKVAVLDDADDLNEEASNCFLKTLEEPPPGSLLILVGGSNVERQLPTILSRCQVIRFAPPAPALGARILAEKGITDPLRLQRLLQLAAGSPGQALALDDDEVWKFRDALLNTLAGGRLVPDQLIRPWMEFIENAGKESAAQRGRAALIIRLFLLMVETALKLSIAAAVPGLDAREEETLRKIGTSLGEERLLAWIERALEADRQIDYRVQLVLIVEAFVDAICR